MRLSTRKQENASGGLTSPDLRFRTSTTMWGPLQLTLTNHREGAELGYEAGQAAYQDDQGHTLDEAMCLYLAAPRYRPRVCTAKIVQEWRAMFLLGWTSGLLEEPQQEAVTNKPQLYLANQEGEPEANATDDETMESSLYRRQRLC